MSQENVKIKISMEDARSFYDSVYKSYAQSETALEKHSEEYLSEINSNVLLKRQNEYKLLITDFLAVNKDRNITVNDTIKYLDISSESWNIWMFSKNKESKINPITFNNATIYKMSALVLKDLAIKHVEENKLSTFESKDLKDIITKAKQKITGAVKPTFDDFDDGSSLMNEKTKTNKIKP